MAKLRINVKARDKTDALSILSKCGRIANKAAKSSGKKFDDVNINVELENQADEQIEAKLQDHAASVLDDLDRKQREADKQTSLQEINDRYEADRKTRVLKAEREVSEAVYAWLGVGCKLVAKLTGVSVR